MDLACDSSTRVPKYYLRDLELCRMDTSNVALRVFQEASRITDDWLELFYSGPLLALHTVPKERGTQ